MKVIRYHYRGQVERWAESKSRYAWHDGYSEGEAGSVIYPWMTKKECREDAKRQGGKAAFTDRWKGGKS